MHFSKILVKKILLSNTLLQTGVLYFTMVCVSCLQWSDHFQVNLAVVRSFSGQLSSSQVIFQVDLGHESSLHRGALSHD